MNLKDIFDVKVLLRFYLFCQINLTIGERPNKKYIQLLNLTRKVNLLRLRRGNTKIDIENPIFFVYDRYFIKKLLQITVYNYFA